MAIQKAHHARIDANREVKAREMERRDERENVFAIKCNSKWENI